MIGYRQTRLALNHKTIITAAAGWVVTAQRPAANDSTYELIRAELYLSQAGTLLVEKSEDEGTTYFTLDSQTWLASDYYIHEIYDPAGWIRLTFTPDVDTNASGFAVVSGVEW